MSKIEELIGKARSLVERDQAMMKITDYYIHQPGIGGTELAQMDSVVPFLNGLPENLVEMILSRVLLVKDLLGTARCLVGDLLKLYRLGGPGGEETLVVVRNLAVENTLFVEPVINIMHVILADQTRFAEEQNLPLREFQASLARVGIETCVYVLLNCKDENVRKNVKLAMTYFSSIEMLSIGCRTNAHQLSFVDPQNVRPELLDGVDRIALMMDVDNDQSLKAAFAFGQINASKIIPSGIPGMNFLYPE